MSSTVLGVRFDSVTMAQALDRALALAERGRCAYICTANPEIVWAARKNEALGRALAEADMTLADGVGVVWASRQLGQPLPERVAGFDLMTALLEKTPGPVYLLGGKPGVAERAADAIARQYPAVTVAGLHDGYFDDPAPILAEMSAAGPSLIFVCLGSPKQELFMLRARQVLPAGLMIGLGGSLDVLAGDVPRAPERWRRRGLEWLYRLVRQPWRSKRILFLPLFVLDVLIKKRGSKEPQRRD